MRSARAVARRDLPIPGSPEISTICPSPFQARRCRSSRKSSSSSRPMKSVRPALRTASKRLSESDTPSTAHAATGSAIPLTSCRPRSRRRNRSPSSLRVEAATTIVPGSPKSWRRVKVRRLPDYGALAQCTLAAEVADHYQAARDADANRERFPGARLELGNRGNDIQSRPHGSLGIVFVREGIAEIGQYPVPPELGEEAVIASRNTGAGGVIGIDHGTHVLRIESSRQGSRAHQIADHHCEMAALGSVFGEPVDRRKRVGKR